MNQSNNHCSAHVLCIAFSGAGCRRLEWFQAYLLINAVALFKVVAAHRRHYPEKEPLNAVGILRSYPFHQSRSFTQKALQSGMARAA